jgi:Tannase and feruloyl esterase
VGFAPFEAMVGWVERDQEPDRIVAVGRQDRYDPASPILQTRPVFPYPLVAKYDGSGSIDDERNFVPARPLVDPKHDTIDWIGAYLHNLPGPVAR